jgi:hypothetical protein
MSFHRFSQNRNVPTPAECGLPDSVLNGISPRYIVTISAFKANQLNTPYIKINAYLQDAFSIDVGSKWSDISQAFGGKNGVADDIAQIGTGILSWATGNKSSPHSLVSAASSRRKWDGSTPPSMQITMKFEAIRDMTKEVILPCMRLQQLALPREGITGGYFLIPPGPNPFADPADQSQGTSGDHISLNIGNFLNFDSVIIEKAGVTYQNRMGSAGPIGATVLMTISTYELLTQNRLAKAYGFDKNSNGTYGSSYDQTGNVSLGTPNPGVSSGAGR